MAEVPEQARYVTAVHPCQALRRGFETPPHLPEASTPVCLWSIHGRYAGDAGSAADYPYWHHARPPNDWGGYVGDITLWHAHRLNRSMTLSELLELAYRFHPRGLHPASLEYGDTKEHGRQLAAVRAARSEYPKWAAMLDGLRARFSVEDRSMYLFGDGFFDSAYLATVFFTSQGQEHGLGFHVSILGPHYVVHRLGRPGEEPCAQAVIHSIEATYPGYEPIPPELGDAIVPDVMVCGKGLGMATIYDCLLSAQGGGSRPGESRSPLPWNCPPVESPGSAPVRKGGETFRFQLVPGKPKPND